MHGVDELGQVLPQIFVFDNLLHSDHNTEEKICHKFCINMTFKKESY